MARTTQQAQHPMPRKKTLDARLMSGPAGTVDDVRVQSGYPIWNLIAAWMSSNFNDGAVTAGYALPPDEWGAAKSYYRDHKPIIDARIIAASQPADDDDVPALRSVEDYFAWLATQSDDSGSASANTASHG